MKLSSASIVFYFVASMATSVSADDLIIAIRTGLLVSEPLQPAEVQAIDVAMHNIGSDLDSIVEDVTSDAPSTRNLRDNGERALRCNPCYGYPEWWAGCWVSGVYYDQCRRDLALHQDLSEEDMAELNEEDRRRHLQVSQLCREAKVGISSAINDAGNEGTIPVPDGGHFIQQCLYEYI
jgi:hypothetical protein